MSELTFAGGGAAERAIEFNVDNSSVTAGAAVFFETIREVTDRECQGGGHPIAVRAWVLDGPDAGAYEDDLWVFPKGIRSKINPAPGAKTAGRLETYKAYGTPKVGLTNLTDEQRQLAEAKNAELKNGGGAPASTPSTSTNASDAPPF
jgi:hypothetical protein